LEEYIIGIVKQMAVVYAHLKSVYGLHYTCYSHIGYIQMF